MRALNQILFIPATIKLIHGDVQSMGVVVSGFLEGSTREARLLTSHVGIHLLPAVVTDGLKLFGIGVEDKDGSVVFILKAHSVLTGTGGWDMISSISYPPKGWKEEKVNTHLNSGWIQVLKSISSMLSKTILSGTNSESTALSALGWP